jgi:hypothetical protein
MTAAAKASPRATAPIDLTTIKDDLGIAAGDTSNDAWLQRRIDGIWGRIQTYTARPMMLAGGWVDDWGQLITNHPAYTEPPLIRAIPSGTVYLRVFPVAAITKLTLDATDQAVSRLIFDAASGKLVALDGIATDLRSFLLYSQARIEYTAGFSVLPDDLYEVVYGALQPQWSARQASMSGIGGTPARVVVQDVGEVQMMPAANFFIQEATQQRASGGVDPLLGPFNTVLDPYVDWRTMLGGAYPTTVALP